MSSNYPSANELKPLIEAGFTLIPLRGTTKVPRDKNWNYRPYKNDHQVQHMDNGNNVGVRLRATDFVIDVDPRNFEEGDDPLERLCSHFEIDLSECPTVETGSGGLHIYMAKPPAVDVKTKLPDFPGVEIKSINTQVVAPGSIHPDTGEMYKWIRNEDDLWCPPIVCEALLEALARSSNASPTADGGEYDPEEIATILSGLNPEEFRDHDDWLKLMMACHHASNGAARQEFIEWSISDPEFADQSEVIGDRWDSLGGNENESVVTHRTLYTLLIEAGREDLIPRPTAAEDFPDPLQPEDLPPGALDSKPDNTPKPLDSDAPAVVAKAMLKDKPMLRSNGDWYKYDKSENRYKAVEPERFTSWCWKWIQDRPYLDRSKNSAQTKRMVAGKGKVANIEEAARSERQGPKQAPAWYVNKPGDPSADELLVCANGLLHLPTRNLLPPTRRFFSVNGSPVRYEPNAPKPERWLQFLIELFPEEQDCIDALQEATGYFLSQDTSLQKIIQFVGPPRSGKGVYTRVLQELIGKGNHTTPSTKRLAGEFGLQPLIGKQLAVIADMRLGRGASSSGLTETLLNVSGEDSVSISRKYKDNWEGKLNTRFLIVSNEVLQLRDVSNALGSRMILIVTRQTFQGKEDEGLTRKLMNELPGILNWALEGLDRLKKRGHFVQPKSCIAEVLQMDKLTSPVKWFLDNELIVGSGHKIKKDDLWEAFDAWTFEEGLTYNGGKEHFIKDLNSAGGRFEQSRVREKGGRVSYVHGLDIEERYMEMKYLEALRDFKDDDDFQEMVEAVRAS